MSRRFYPLLPKQLIAYDNQGVFLLRLPCAFVFPLLLILVSCCPRTTGAQPFDRQDTLRGSNGSGRNWWDVQRYDLRISFDLEQKSIRGENTITFKVTGAPRDSMQIDLQTPMFLDSVIAGGKRVDAVKDGNVWWLQRPFAQLRKGDEGMLTIYYHGKPHEAAHPPWDGGFVWRKDSLGNPWVAVACQGFGASCWWPCKDYQGDEPDSGMQISLSKEYSSELEYPKSKLLHNGKLLEETLDTVVRWYEKFQDSVAVITAKDVLSVSNPINTYNVTFYLGNYAEWKDTIQGLKGTLGLTFNPLRYHESQARKHFVVAKQMLHCFEYWLGPYPFYEDGYKLVEAPYLGMEHQSAVAYGNQYKMGYLGQDRSLTGIGKLFDFIIVHESGHEWFGNSITAQDVADNWIHEGFTTYCEALFVECAFGKDSAFLYTRGQWKNIENDRPVIGNYGVNDDGTGDKYDKGSAVVHMVRMMLNDDEKFRQLLQGLNRDFYHQIIATDQVERYMEKAVGRDLRPFFDQYLRTTKIPVLEVVSDGNGKKAVVRFRVSNAVPGFVLPVSFSTKKAVYANSDWQEVKARDVHEDWRGDVKNWLLEIKEQ